MSIPNKPLIETRAEKLAKAIFRTPYGFLVIALCIVIYYQFQMNLDCQEQLKTSNKEHIEDLRNIQKGLEKISDTTTHEIK
jgi:hypothetical protein